jgi:hypothetical protein
MKLRYGGDLQIGDFIMIANSNYTSFGWYCGRGRGTVQYYHFRVPAERYKTFQEWEAGKLPNLNKWYREKFEKHGFSSKLFYKEYIYGGGLDVAHGSRVIKLTDPESIFTNQEDLEDYRKSKEALIYIKFPAK